MADFKTPNLCGANPELNTALSKIDDLKNEIASKVDSLASEAAAAFKSKLADVKAGLDGLAIGTVGIVGLTLGVISYISGNYHQ